MVSYMLQKRADFIGSHTLSSREEWENQFESIEGVLRISDNNVAYLNSRLANCEELDTYLSSAAYYMFTGRNGLWLFSRRNTFLLVCWHPNYPGRILIFPQLGECDFDLISDLLECIPVPPFGVSIARVNASRQSKQSGLLTSQRHIVFNECIESILDWKFPVHILSTKRTADLEGQKYAKVRNKIRRIRSANTNILPFDAISHSRAVENLLHRWAKHNASDHEEYTTLYDPYECLISWSTERTLGLSGLMVFIDNKLQAVTLWDVSNGQQKTANLFVNFCNIDIIGLSDFMVVESCKTLRDQGVDYLNLGGSESDGLDSFKRKFCPARSINMCSIDVRIDKTNCAANTNLAVA